VANVCEKGYSILILIDGMHPICKAHFEGRESIKVYQFEEDPEPSYLDMTDVDVLLYD